MDQIKNNYGLVDAFHGELMGLHAQFIATQEEIQSDVAQLGEHWEGSSSEAHHTWQLHFNKISSEVQQAAAQAFGVLSEEIGSGGNLHSFDMSAASRFGA